MRRTWSLPLAAGLLLLLVAPVLGTDGSAPQVSLGPLTPLFLQIRPYLATLFVALGFYVILQRLGFHLLSHLRSTPENERAIEPASAMQIFGAVLSVAAAVIFAVVVLYVGLDTLNGTLTFLHSAVTTQSPTP